MNEDLFIASIGLGTLALFLRLKAREPDEGAWWLGILHVALMVLALLGFRHAGDPGFALGMGLLAAYAGIMATARLLPMLRSGRVR